MEQRLREALAHQLHVVIRHGGAARREPHPRLGRVLERAILVIDELARAARITSRVWSEALHAAIEPSKDRSFQGSSQLRPELRSSQLDRPNERSSQLDRPELRSSQLDRPELRSSQLDRKVIS